MLKSEKRVGDVDFYLNAKKIIHQVKFENVTHEDYPLFVR